MIDWNFVQILGGLIAVAFVIGHIGERLHEVMMEDEE